MGCCCSKSATQFDTTHFKNALEEDDELNKELSQAVLSLATSDGGSDATTPGSAGTPGIDFEAVAQELPDAKRGAQDASAPGRERTH